MFRSVVLPIFTFIGYLIVKITCPSHVCVKHEGSWYTIPRTRERFTAPAIEEWFHAYCANHPPVCAKCTRVMLPGEYASGYSLEPVRMLWHFDHDLLEALSFDESAFIGIVNKQGGIQCAYPHQRMPQYQMVQRFGPGIRPSVMQLPRKNWRIRNEIVVG